jgi:hypothetical protein
VSTTPTSGDGPGPAGAGTTGAPGHGRGRVEDAPGLRHALGLSAAVALPLGIGVAAATARNVAGFPTVVVVLLTLIAGLLGAALAAVTPLPKLRQLGARLLGSLVAALLVRLTIPSPAAAVRAVLAWEAPLVTGSVVVVTLLLLVAHAYGHLFMVRVTAVAVPSDTMERRRWAEERLTSAAWGAAVLLTVVAAATGGATGALGVLVTVAAVLAGLWLLADLRDRTRPPGARRAAVLAVPRRVRRTSIALALAAATALAVLAVPLLPTVDVLGGEEPPGWLQRLTLPDTDRPRQLPSDPVISRHVDPDDEDVEVREVEDAGLITLPTWPLAVLLGALVVGLLMALRPASWLATLRRLLAVLSGGRLGGDPDADGELDAVERAAREGAGGGRWRDALERLRPRPRDPRHAIVHDYLRAERALARADRGRASTETPLEHATRVRLDRQLDGLAALVSTARYAPGEPTEADADEARRLAADVQEAVRALVRADRG